MLCHRQRTHEDHVFTGRAEASVILSKGRGSVHFIVSHVTIPSPPPPVGDHWVDDLPSP